MQRYAACATRAVLVVRAAARLLSDAEHLRGRERFGCLESNVSRAASPYLRVLSFRNRPLYCANTVQRCKYFVAVQMLSGCADTVLQCRFRVVVQSLCIIRGNLFECESRSSGARKLHKNSWAALQQPYSVLYKLQNDFDGC